jgi:hypothetical protein
MKCLAKGIVHQSPLAQDHQGCPIAVDGFVLVCRWPPMMTTIPVVMHCVDRHGLTEHVLRHAQRQRDQNRAAGHQPRQSRALRVCGGRLHAGPDRARLLGFFLPDTATPALDSWTLFDMAIHWATGQ